MNEQPIRIVVSTTTSAFKRDPTGMLHLVHKPMIYQKGLRLPQPEGIAEDPLIVIDIQEFDADPETGEDAFFLVYSVGEDNTPFQQHDIGVLTKVPADLVIRKDGRVSAIEMLNELKKAQADALRAQQEAEEEERLEAEAEQHQQAAPAVPQPGFVHPPPVRQPVQAPQAPQPPSISVNLPPEVAQMAPPVFESPNTGLMASMGSMIEENTNASDDRK
jgi:hypothetical protein